MGVCQCATVLNYATKDLKNNPYIVWDAVRNFGGALGLASAALQADRYIVMQAVKNYGRALYFASPQLRNDVEIVKVAAANMAFDIFDADPRFRQNHVLLMEIVAINGRVLVELARRGTLLANQITEDMVAIAMNTSFRAFDYYPGLVPDPRPDSEQASIKLPPSWGLLKHGCRLAPKHQLGLVTHLFILWRIICGKCCHCCW